jgi:hypothetical protein
MGMAAGEKSLQETISFDGEKIFLKATKKELILKIASCHIVFSPKTIRTNCPLTKAYQQLLSNRRYLYLYLYKSSSIESKPYTLKHRRGYTKKTLTLYSFLISIIPISLGSYLTLITPGTFSYDRAILYNSIIMIETSGKKEFTATKAGDETVFVVKKASSLFHAK